MHKRYITLKQFVILGNKYMGTISDVYGPEWARNVFFGIYSLFNGTEDNVYIDGETPTKLLPYYQQGSGFLTMMNDFVARYGDRLIAYPWYEGMSNVYYGRGVMLQKIDNCTEEQAFTLVYSYLVDKSQQWLAMNSYEAIRIQSVLQLDYNPIDNYNMTETNVGSKELIKTINKDQIGFIDVNTPINSISVTKDEDTGKFTLDSVGVVADRDVEASGNSATTDTNRNGFMGSTVSAGSDGASYTLEEGTGRSVTEQVTTYDDDAFHDNKKSNSEGDTVTAQSSAVYSKTKAIGMAEIRLGSPDAGYSETETMNGLGLTRSGNIGVTTTQQMIEQELTLRERPHIERIIDNYFNNMLINVFV